MKKYITEQPEKGKRLDFIANGGEIMRGEFDGVNFVDENKSVKDHPTNNKYSVLAYDIEWKYI